MPGELPRTKNSNKFVGIHFLYRGIIRKMWLFGASVIALPFYRWPTYMVLTTKHDGQFVLLAIEP
jgi:hypothetical protein